MVKELLHSRLFNFILLMLFLFLLFGGMYIAKPFLIPVSFAAIFAMLLLPLSRKLEAWKFPRALSIILSIFLALLVVGGVITVLSTQIAGFAKDVPVIRENISKKFEVLQDFIHNQTGVAPDRQLSLVRDRLSGLIETGGTYVQKVFVSTTGALATIGIILIYVFFFLFYRDRFKNFILKITPELHAPKTRSVISQISLVTQNYLTGVLTVVLVLAVMNTTGLLIIGIKHALFFGVLAALLNIIPYIGTFIGGLIPTIYALITEDSLGVAIGVAAVFVISQFVENNFLTPLIVGSKVKVNPLATIIALLVGGFLWGVAGMILFIPFLGVAKIIFDNVESLEPFGYLIGEEEHEGPSTWQKLKDKIMKKRR